MKDNTNFAVLDEKDSCFSEFAENSKKEFEKLIQKPKFILAGANYSYIFIVPKIIDIILRFNDKIDIEVKLLEVVSRSDLKSSDFDIFITGDYSQGRLNLRKIFKKSEYSVSDTYLKEDIYLGASKKAVEMYGGIKNTLKKHNLLTARAPFFSGDKDFIKVPFSAKPKGRGREQSFITSDEYWFSYELMLQGVGIWYYAESMFHLHDLVRLEDVPKSTLDRYFVYKKEYQFLIDEIMSRK